MEQLSTFDAVLGIAGDGHFEAAESIVENDVLLPKFKTSEIVEELLTKAASEEEDADDIENGKLYSYATAPEHRKQAENLKAFAKSLKN